MSLDQEIFCANEEETLSFAEAFAPKVPRGTVLLLHGDLGAGKTSFARGFIRGLGVTEPVTSQTFTIVQEYPLPDLGFAYHIDLYRLENSDEAEGFGILDFLMDHDSYNLIEWPERGIELFNTLNQIDIFICYDGVGRKIKIKTKS